MKEDLNLNNCKGSFASRLADQCLQTRHTKARIFILAIHIMPKSQPTSQTSSSDPNLSQLWPSYTSLSADTSQLPASRSLSQSAHRHYFSAPNHASCRGSRYLIGFDNSVVVEAKVS
ncbi:hypothetical protein K491DRAFT_689884 [Lophiostoma macrostomum CBS 122681]|uniref:Uncharacterized protein n=1 Tax=Lophiostoma macrostomum CBS 122681 TaxID=1314788 RepID=A0A6A6TFS0_9PLEO|nr:hypothetical protein K491DRAFT_689884 [Lophiostoma macrostomum CBS 122681]